MDDEIIATESETYLKSRTYLNEDSSSKAHVECQINLKKLRETMDNKDIEISR